jgi:hypothetical protein
MRRERRHRWRKATSKSFRLRRRWRSRVCKFCGFWFYSTLQPPWRLGAFELIQQWLLLISLEQYRDQKPPARQEKEYRGYADFASCTVNLQPHAIGEGWAALNYQGFLDLIETLSGFLGFVAIFGLCVCGFILSISFKTSSPIAGGLIRAAESDSLFPA